MPSEAGAAMPTIRGRAPPVSRSAPFHASTQAPTTGRSPSRRSGSRSSAVTVAPAGIGVELAGRERVAGALVHPRQAGDERRDPWAGTRWVVVTYLTGLDVAADHTGPSLVRQIQELESPGSDDDEHTDHHDADERHGRRTTIFKSDAPASLSASW